ncbi:hypothetical protein ACFX13_019123 [Malus domestica]
MASGCCVALLKTGNEDLLGPSECLGLSVLQADIAGLDNQQNLLPLSYEMRYRYPSCPYKVGVSIDPYNYDVQDHIIDHTVSVMTSTLLES